MAAIDVNEIWSIHPIDWSAVEEGELSARYLRMLLRWVRFAEQQFEEWPVRPNCGHFFGGCYGYGMDTSFPAGIYAVLAKIGDYDPAEYGLSRERLKERAVKGLRYLGFTHGTGPTDCVRPLTGNPNNAGKKWGTTDEDFFRATQTGRTVSAMCLAARFLWEDLDDETKLMIQRIAASYADRWCDEQPRTGTYNDTQEEENAWTANGISAAMDTFPEHPHHEKWKKGFIRWSANSVLSYKDCYLQETELPARTRRTVAVEKPPLTHVTIHADWSTENHGFMHPDYLKAGINLRGKHLITSWIGGRDVLSSALYNNELIYDQVIMKCIQKDGFGIPVQGQDWYYAKQHESLFTHAILNVVHEHSDAARVEREVLDRMERLQLSHSTGCLVEEDADKYWLNVLQTLKSVETMNAWSLLLSYLLHAFGGNGVQPTDNEELQLRLEGVHHYPYGSFIVHRTKSAFNSFNWRSHVMAYSAPEAGTWTVTPMFQNYTGTVEFAESTGVKGWTNEETIRFAERSAVYPAEDGFGACVTVLRGDRELSQDIAFVSMPDGRSVYFEQFRALKACRIKRLQTGMIGVRNERYKKLPEVAGGTRTVYLSGGSRETFEGYLGEEPDDLRKLPTVSYLNLDGQIGYRVFGSHGMAYLNRHHFSKYVGVENSLILNCLEQAALADGETLPPLVVAALPGSTMEETAEESAHMELLETGAGQALLLEVRGYLVYAHFGDKGLQASAVKRLQDRCRTTVYTGSNRIAGGSRIWGGKLEAYKSGYIAGEYELEWETGAEPSVVAAVLPDRLLLTNDAAHSIRLRVYGPGGRQLLGEPEIGPGGFAQIMKPDTYWAST